MKKDNLHKYLVMDRQARVITVFSTNVVNEYCKNINTTPVSVAAMGRLLSATLMMGSMLKGKESVMVTINGNGPIGTIKAEADSVGNVRGYATNPNIEVPNRENGMLDVAAAVGSEGYLQVRRQMNLKEPFIGTCELISGEIGEDLSYYFGTSEQTPTIVALGVLANKDGTCKQAGGFIIQLLPNASEEAYKFFSHAKEVYKNAKDKDAALAYIYGFINHFVLDHVCHGYVYYMQEKLNMGHYEIESEFDRECFRHSLCQGSKRHPAADFSYRL